MNARIDRRVTEVAQTIAAHSAQSTATVEELIRHTITGVACEAEALAILDGIEQRAATGIPHLQAPPKPPTGPQ